MSDWPTKSTPRVCPGVRTLVLGGIRSGKSAFAEAIARSAEDITTVRYVATGRTGDTEMERRIAAHQARRPSEWETVETSDTADLMSVLRDSEADELLLIDSLGEWLSWRLLEIWDDGYPRTEQPDEPSPTKESLQPGEASRSEVMVRPEQMAQLEGLVEQLADAVRRSRAALVLVGHEVGEGGVAMSPIGRAFADANGLLSQRVATACDMVFKVTAGIPQRLR